MAKNYIKTLQKYEHSPEEVIEINEGKETEQFIKLWFDDEKLKTFDKSGVSGIVDGWNNWYKDVDITARLEESQKKAKLLKNKENNEKEVSAINIVKIKKAFYLYCLILII